jgi:hypothetical protein
LVEVKVRTTSKTYTKVSQRLNITEHVQPYYQGKGKMHQKDGYKPEDQVYWVYVTQRAHVFQMIMVAKFNSPEHKRLIPDESTPSDYLVSTGHLPLYCISGPKDAVLKPTSDPASCIEDKKFYIEKERALPAGRVSCGTTIPK